MNNWKDLAKHGRGGDTMIKKIDGMPAHVNAVEYEMSPEYIKEHGAGTINPVTGLKEYQVPGAEEAAGSMLGGVGDFLGNFGIGMGLLSSVMGGFSAMANKKKVAEAKEAALGIRDEELDMISGQYKTASSGVGFGTNINLRKTQAFGEEATSQSNLATLGTVEEQGRIANKNIWAQYKSDTQKLIDSRKTSERAVERSYQDTLTQLESIPTTFMEGIFG